MDEEALWNGVHAGYTLAMSRPVATISDVARLAGTSTGTVSRILNGHPGASTATHNRVSRAIEALNFSPNAAARSLARAARHAPLFTFAFPGHALSTPYYARLRQALLSAAENHGFRVLELDEDAVATAKADAVLFVRDEFSPLLLDRLKARRRAVVVIGRHERASWVCIDDQRGMTEVTRSLLDAGHRSVAHLGSEHTLSIMPQARALGYRQAMEAEKLPVELIELEEGGFELGAYRAVRRAWSRGKRFTALTCLCDEAALGAILALQDLGMRVPEDVSVVGFDGLPQMAGSLTTMRQNLHEIAETALALLGSEVQERRHREVVLAATLVKGRSVSRHG